MSESGGESHVGWVERSDIPKPRGIFMSNQRIENLLEAIDESSGGIANIWEYTVSLSQLTIRITRVGESKNLHFVCNGCSRIEAFSTWNDVNLLLQTNENGLYQLIDEKAKFLVECNSVRAFRDVAPLYSEATQYREPA